jgi:solute carrier family 25 phosphate transporter 23/24/25/41
VNSEGDVHVSETVEGLGKHQFSRTLFGALPKIFKLPQPSPPAFASTAIQRIDATQVVDESKPLTFPWDPGDQYPQYEDIVEPDLFAGYRHEKEARLTDLLPPAGYFVAGGISGVVSRTATAPLDRLKVYLIAQVGVKDDAIHHAKSGAPVKAAKTATRPLVEATKTLWRMGGMRSLFAGQFVALRR